MVPGISVRRVCAVAVVAALVGVGCSEGGGRSGSTGSSTSEAVEGQESSDGEVIEAYVEAMSDGDVDAAMDLRCKAGRIAPKGRELFEGDLRRLTRATGPLGVGRIEVTDSDPPVEAPLEGRHALELTYWLTLDGDEVDEPLVSIVVDEDGERRICTFSTAERARMHEILGEGLVDLGQTGRHELTDLMPSSLGPGYRLDSDGRSDPATLPDTLAGAIDVWSRSWQQEPYGGVRVSAMRFRSGDDALRAAREWVARDDDAAIEAFVVPDLDGAQGVRFLAFEWLWLQPPTVGPYVDEISLVFGDTYVIVSIGGVPTGSGHESAIARAQQVARLALG